MGIRDRIESLVLQALRGSLMKIIFAVLFMFAAFAHAAFTENAELWAEIDRINEVLDGCEEIDSDSLEILFQETVEIALSMELSEQFEELRADAFQSDDFTLCDTYADRAYDAINVFILGESNAIGVNTTAFLDRSPQDSEAGSFFLVCIGGFYVDGQTFLIGTAELPAWMERTGSSAQARVIPEVAGEWLSYWQSILPSLDGYFMAIADETTGALSAYLE